MRRDFILGVLVMAVVAIEIQAATEGVLKETSAVKVRAYSRIFDVTRVSLLDVVERDGLSSDVEKKMAAISLGDGPKLGELRVYSNKAIAEAIRRSGPKKSWSIQIPHKVTVENRGYQIDRDSVESDLLAHWKTLCPDCQVQIKNLQLPALPSYVEKRPWRLEKDGHLPRANFAQKLVIILPENREQIFWINGQIEVKKKVPVLTRSTPMNTRLTESDYKMEWRDVTFATDTSPMPAEIVGQQAKYTMNANDIIWRGSLVREKAVQRGEIVKVFVGEDNWQISLQAITEQDGFIGDIVNLRNLQTQRVMTGRVVRPGEVEIR